MPDITYPAPAGPLPGYLCEPAGTGPWPGVVAIHDALGMTADIRRIAERFAASGYLALAPALYRRGPTANRPRCVVSTMRSLSSGEGPAVDDIVAARDRLAADPRCTGKIGVVGFCMGGGFCMLLAPRGVFDVAAPNYGNWPKVRDALRRSCPMVASYGAKDRMLPGAAAELESLLTEGGVAHDVKEYPDVGHSFMNQFVTPGPLGTIVQKAGFAYSERESEDAWRRILAFFGEHLAADSQPAV
jgi:carboxymethylenebutenolidase